jgi:hypothetical protein
MVDLEKYKDEMQGSRSESSSPDKVNKEESEKKENEGKEENSNQMSQSKNLHEKIIEV